MMGLHALDYEEFVHPRALSWSLALSSFFFWCEDTVRRWPSAKPEKRPHPISTLDSGLRCSASEMVGKLMSVV